MEKRITLTAGGDWCRSGSQGRGRRLRYDPAFHDRSIRRLEAAAHTQTDLADVAAGGGRPGVSEAGQAYAPTPQAGEGAGDMILRREVD